jgi:hypothetical protein
MTKCDNRIGRVRSSGFKVQGFLPVSMFHPPTTSPSTSGSRLSTLNHQLPVGIPRALTTHSLFPLYSTFFAGLGLEVVLSKVDPRGELKSYSGFCFPAQIAHGALLDLAERGVDLVFLPHIVRMPQDNPCRDSYLCPVTQAGPYFLAKAFPDLRLLSPVLDFTLGYEASLALVDLAVRELGNLFPQLLALSRPGLRDGRPLPRPAPRRGAAAWTAPNSSAASSTPRAANACRCRSASANSFTSASKISPVSSPAST